MLTYSLERITQLYNIATSAFSSIAARKLHGVYSSS